ncbi:MAG: copper chaperone [Tunicatimonas sp.]
MKTFKFKTNIDSERCVEQVASYLDNTTDIAGWGVDTENADKVLTVESNDHLDSHDVVDIINLAGFSARLVKKRFLYRLLA